LHGFVYLLPAALFLSDLPVVCLRFWLASSPMRGKSGGFVSYGVDNFMTIGSFIWTIAACRIDILSTGDYENLRTENPELLVSGIGSSASSVPHLFFSGLTKCLGSGWWDGSNIWRSLIRRLQSLIPRYSE